MGICYKSNIDGKTVRAQSELARGMSEKPTMAARRIVLPTGSRDSTYDMHGWDTQAIPLGSM